MRYIAFSASVEYIFSPPFPRLPYATIDAVYPRDLYIFYVRARTYIHTYISLLRRHSTPLLRIKRNAIRDTAPPVCVASYTIHIHRFRSSLDVSIFPNFFSLSSKILFPLHTREKLSCDLLDRLGNSPLIKGYVLLTRRGLDTICNFKFSAASAPINGPTGRRGARFIVIKCQHDRRPAISSYLKFFQLRKLAAAYRGHLVGSLASGDHPLPSYFVSCPTFLSVYRGRQSSRSTRVTFRHSRI